MHIYIYIYNTSNNEIGFARPSDHRRLPAEHAGPYDFELVIYIYIYIYTLYIYIYK